MAVPIIPAVGPGTDFATIDALLHIIFDSNTNECLVSLNVTIDKAKCGSPKSQISAGESLIATGYRMPAEDN